MRKFGAFILTNRRPDRVITYALLRKCGYTGPIHLVVDDLDPTIHDYRERYGAELEVFDKRASQSTFDSADNFDNMSAIVYARNACFGIAKRLGYSHFIQLDDDYTYFTFRFDEQLCYIFKDVKDLDAVFASLLRFYDRCGAASIAVSQGGDFLGGSNSSHAKKIKLRRKCMNSFICSTERPFQFLGRINEDVNTYTRAASTGALFLTLTHLSIGQKQTQSNAGGMTELYLDSGTYVKSFYTILFMPSCVTIGMMGYKTRRLHHRIKWRHAVPCLLSESHRRI